MKDFKGKNLAVGDKVIFVWNPYGAKHTLEKGRIKSLGKSKATIEYDLNNKYDNGHPSISVIPEKIYKI